MKGLKLMGKAKLGKARTNKVTTTKQIFLDQDLKDIKDRAIMAINDYRGSTNITLSHEVNSGNVEIVLSEKKGKFNLSITQHIWTDGEEMEIEL